MGKVSVKGNVTNSTIGAGLTLRDGAIDLPWLEANDAFVDGSRIDGLGIGGNLTGTTAAHGVGADRIGKVKIKGTGEGCVFTGA